MLFRLHNGFIQLENIMGELGIHFDVVNLIQICLKACIMYRERGITLVVSDFNMFYLPK